MRLDSATSDNCVAYAGQGSRKGAEVHVQCIVDVTGGAHIRGTVVGWLQR